MQRIGIDCRLWAETGIGRYIQNLVQELGKIATNNTYVLFCLEKDAQDIRAKIKEQRFKIQIANIRWHSWKEQLILPWILTKEKLDLMHFPYFSVPILYPGKFVMTVHDMIPWIYPTGEASTLPGVLYWFKQYAYRLITTIASKRAEKLIAVSQATKQVIQQTLHVIPKKIVVIYEGIEHAKPIKKKITSPIQKQYFLSVGNAYPHKNIYTLLLAFKKFSLQHPEVLLVLVGKKNYFYQKLETFIQNHALTNIHFAGFVPDEELGYLYEHAIATVIPSLMEGFGLPALEAMSYGCPVIAADIPSLSEIADNGAVYVDATNPEKLAEVFSQMVEEKDLRKHLIINGQKRIGLFSWRKTAQQTEGVYESCLGLR